jgi:polyferredoxin
MKNQIQKSLSLANPHPPFADPYQKLFSAIGGLGLLILAVASLGVEFQNKGLWLAMALILISTGTVLYAYRAYCTRLKGIKNDGNFFSSIVHRGVIGWISGIVITGFYILLYFYPELLGLGNEGDPNTGLVGFFDPLSLWMKGTVASQWFVYGTLYTLAILVFGIKFILKYRHNNYQIIRTAGVMFFQLFFAFLIPELMEGLNKDLEAKWFDKDLKNMWPLDYDFFDQWHIDNMSSAGMLGSIYLIFSLLLVFVISPILTYKYGKRWYCSWVCGCGGLAETAGDAFRHLSDKSLKAWRIERWTIHLVLFFSFIMTTAVIYSYLGEGNQYYITKNTFTIILLIILSVNGWLFYYFMKKKKQGDPNVLKLILGFIGITIVLYIINYISGSSNAFFIDNYQIKKYYGFLIGAIFSGVIGVGFYPLMGSRVWCRFGCPMAAILGLQQRLFSKFRITTNGGQCISCGNCSTYCEMGIDVRSYAQKGQNIVRASCVGCGICAAVCPRGVLKLENGSSDIYERTTNLKAIHISEKEIKIIK